MSLNATHVRFALEYQKQLQVKNLTHYLSGTIYPDSRYFTNIVREKTHGKKIFDHDFMSLNDFQKGWWIHLMTDQVNKNSINKLFASFSPDLEGKIIFGSPSWIFRTAVKILHDVISSKKLSINQLSDNFIYIDNPVNEDKEVLKEYYKRVRDFYCDRENFNYQSYYQYFINMNFDEEVVKKLIDKAAEFSTDDDFMKKFELLYQDMKNQLDSML